VASAQLFYMKQTIGNACGTIALLHSIGNVRAELALGAPPSLAPCLGALLPRRGGRARSLRRPPMTSSKASRSLPG
jgi:hypothetical protein